MRQIGLLVFMVVVFLLPIKSALSQSNAVAEQPAAEDGVGELDGDQKALAEKLRDETLPRLRTELASKEAEAKEASKKAKYGRMKQLNLEIKSLRQAIGKFEKWTLAEWLADFKDRQKREFEEKQRKEKIANAPPPGSREEFKSLVRPGMTPEEVVAAVGRPTMTGDSGGSVLQWHYRERTTDMLTGRKDWAATVVFLDGKVNNVKF